MHPLLAAQNPARHAQCTLVLDAHNGWHHRVGNGRASRRCDVEAIEILENQVKSDSLATDFWLLLAQAQRHNNNAEKSQQALANYIKVHGDSPDGWLEYFELGKYYHVQGHTQAAQSIYQATLRMLPNNTEIQDSLRALSN